jgi:hypothetical protein
MKEIFKFSWGNVMTNRWYCNLRNFNYLFRYTSTDYLISVVNGSEDDRNGQRRLRLWSAAARVLESWVRNPPSTLISASCECCVISGRGQGLCDEVVTRPEESYQVWCVWVWLWRLYNEEGLPHCRLLRYGTKKCLWMMNETSQQI